MAQARRSVIVGTGSFVPERRVPNTAFHRTAFRDSEGLPIDAEPEAVVAKFHEITGIRERRYAPDDLNASDLGALAAEAALESSGVDPESLDYLVAAHNFGDIAADNRRTDMVPTVASRIKARLGIANPRCVAYDLPFGCPGWLQGVIQCDYFLRSGDASRALIIGTETVSRVCDPRDRDSMIYADGAGAAVLEARTTDEPVGILAHAARTDAADHAYLLTMAPAPGDRDDDTLFLKMNGHKVYEYAVKTVPDVVLECLEKAGLGAGDLKKILIHQANHKLDEAIVKRVLRAAGVEASVEELMPMTIGWLGNSSVATLPTLLDLILKDGLDGHGLDPGDAVLFASVGAGMNANAVAYRMP